MGRELRMVPKDWKHPKKAGRYVPLHEGPFEQEAARYAEEEAEWKRGFRRDYGTGARKPLDDLERTWTYEDYAGEPPKREDYMPSWRPEERTHFQMYETCTEGTPISPPMPDAESLATWLADNGASAFGDLTASREAWLATIKRGSAVGAVLDSGGWKSGVEAEAELETAK